MSPSVDRGTTGESHVQLLLRDRQVGVVAAWAKAFEGVAGVRCTVGDIFGDDADAVVSPANSFGFMDGGIDLAYSERFGWGLQARLQRHISEHHLGELPVGQAVIVETLDDRIPFLVSAPTMRVPMDVSATPNAYLALRAALIAVRSHNETSSRRISRLLCPGLASAIGAMPFERVARQMRLAWDVVMAGKPWPPATGGAVLRAHHELVS